MINNIRKNVSEFINNIKKEKLIITLELKEAEVKNLTHIVSISEKKEHLTAALPLTDNEDTNYLVSTNLTSHKKINFDKAFKIDANKKLLYPHLETNKISQSFETPIVLSKGDEETLFNAAKPNYNVDDIREITKNQLYPHTFLSEISINKPTKDFYIEKLDNKYKKIMVEEHTSILNKVIKNLSVEKNNIKPAVIEYADILKAVSEKLSGGELEVYYTLKILKETENSGKLILPFTDKHYRGHVIWDEKEIENNAKMSKLIADKCTILLKSGEGLINNL